VFPRDLEMRYVEALKQEIRAHNWTRIPETLYIGGGTPSLMPLEALSEVLSSIPVGRPFRAAAALPRGVPVASPQPPAPWQEATIEASPGTITPERARFWAANGINRVSLGVQSFVNKEIRRAGRKHTAQTVADEVAVLSDAGIRNFNIDLIAGLSGQTESSWRESLEWVERLAAPHVSVYMLEVDDDSRLGRELRLGGARYGAAETPGEDASAEFYEMAVERLAAIGIPRYEISNFARPGLESRHNLKYWTLEPYAGFGADAHSFDGHVRRQNPESAADYVDRAAQPAAEEAADPDHERFFVGLRLMAGIRPSPEEWQRFERPIRSFIDAGLLETAGGTLRLTNRGVLLSNEVFQEFLDL
jgi:oxygen-independent coproporphyrinogen-3 oxidase